MRSTFFYTVPCKGVQGAVAQCAAPIKPGTLGQTPLFSISAVGNLMCATQHTGPTAVRPI